MVSEAGPLTVSNPLRQSTKSSETVPVPVLSAIVPDMLITPVSQGIACSIATPASALLDAGARLPLRMAFARRRAKPVTPVGCGCEGGAASACTATPAKMLVPDAAPLELMMFDAILPVVSAFIVAPVVAPQLTSGVCGGTGL